MDAVGDFVLKFGVTMTVINQIILPAVEHTCDVLNNKVFPTIKRGYELSAKVVKYKGTSELAIYEANQAEATDAWVTSALVNMCILYYTLGNALARRLQSHIPQPQQAKAFLCVKRGWSGFVSTILSFILLYLVEGNRFSPDGQATPLTSAEQYATVIICTEMLTRIYTFFDANKMNFVVDATELTTTGFALFMLIRLRLHGFAAILLTISSLFIGLVNVLQFLLCRTLQANQSAQLQKILCAVRWTRVAVESVLSLSLCFFFFGRSVAWAFAARIVNVCVYVYVKYSKMF